MFKDSVCKFPVFDISSHIVSKDVSSGWFFVFKKSIIHNVSLIKLLHKYAFNQGSFVTLPLICNILNTDAIFPIFIARVYNSSAFSIFFGIILPCACMSAKVVVAGM